MTLRISVSVGHSGYEHIGFLGVVVLILGFVCREGVILRDGIGVTVIYYSICKDLVVEIGDDLRTRLLGVGFVNEGCVLVKKRCLAVELPLFARVENLKILNCAIKLRRVILDLLTVFIEFNGSVDHFAVDSSVGKYRVDRSTYGLCDSNDLCSVLRYYGGFTLAVLIFRSEYIGISTVCPFALVVFDLVRRIFTNYKDNIRALGQAVTNAECYNAKRH